MAASEGQGKARWGARKLSWVGEIALDKRVAPMAFRLAYLLADQFWNWETGQCNPSLETLAELLDVDEKTMRRANQNLKDAGYATWRKGGRGHPNLYLLSFDDRTKMSDQKGAKGEGVVHMTGHFCPDDRTLIGTKMSNEPCKNPVDEPSSAGGPLAQPASERRSSSSSTLENSDDVRGSAGSRPRVFRKGQEITLKDGSTATVEKLHGENIILRRHHDAQRFLVDRAGRVILRGDGVPA